MSLAEDGRPLSLTWHYTPREIVADGVIHGLGVLLGFAGAVALVATAVTTHLGLGERAAVVVYAAALVLMLGVSALYNLYPVSPRKWLLRRADHALIYLMIAGTYTPLVALVGSGIRAYALLAIIWVVALIGIAVKLLLPGRFDRLSIGLYLLLGWSGLLAYESVIAGGSEYMCLAPIVTVGRRSGIPHTTHRRIPIEVGDAVFLEIGACIARYTAPMMRTVAIGPCSQELQRMAEASAMSVDTLIDHIRPGVPGGEIACYAGETLRGLPTELIWHGYYGYSVGLGFPPVWADAPVHIRDGSDSVIEAGMVFHCNTSLRRAGEYGASCGETVLVTEDGCEVLTAVPRGLQIK